MQQAISLLAVVLVLVVLLIFVLLILVVLLLILVVLLLILLVIHREFLPIFVLRYAASIVCPKNQDLSLARKIKLTIKPLTMAAVMPPAVAFNPPVNTPRIP